MSDLFENLALQDDTEVINHRKASAVANKRVKDRFGTFLANAGGKNDLAARVALVEDDIHQIVEDVTSEYGGDAQKIEAAIRRSIMNPMSIGPQGAPNPGMGMPGANPNNPSGGSTCPTCGQPMVNGQCPTCQGGAGASGAAGAYGMMHSIPQAPSTGPIMASGAYCDSCGGWKSGPGKKCTCEGGSMDESHDVSGHKKEVIDETSKESKTALSLETEPIMHPRPLPDEPGKEGVTDIDGELENAPSAVGTGTISSMVTAEALKTEKLPTGDESALGGPSPKIDRGNSGDQHGWSLDPIDTQMDGSPHPTREQDPTDKADYNKEDFLDQTRAVTKTETLPTETGDAGYNTERNIPLQDTDSWTGTDGQHDPVTNVALSSWQLHSDMMYDVGSDRAPYSWRQQPPQGATGQMSNGKFLMGGPEDPASQYADAERLWQTGQGPHPSEAVPHAPQAQRFQQQQAIAAVDPDKNPIRELMEEYSGHMMPTQVEAALEDWSVETP